MTTQQRYHWIDFIKGIAILAVLVDHSFGVLYTSKTAHDYSFFSVTVFIIVAGITSAISISRRKEITPRYVLDRCLTILIPYALATLVFHLVLNHGVFDLILFIQQLFSFSAASPFYFVLFYIQLVAVSPVLYRLFKNTGALQRILLLMLIYFVSVILTDHTVIQHVYGGGGKLLGGTYLFAFSLGMFAFFYLDQLTQRLPVVLIFILSTAGLAFFILSGFNTHLFSNPPNPYLMIYSILVTAFLFSFWILVIERVSILQVLSKPILWTGLFSLYIFLFHRLFLPSAFLAALASQFGIKEHIWLYRAWTIGWIVALCILIGLVFEALTQKKRADQVRGVFSQVNQSTGAAVQNLRAYLLRK